MYMTQIKLNQSRRGTTELVTSRQRLHKAVLDALPNEPESAPEERGGRVLWRTDWTPKTTMLYVQSKTKPDATHIIEAAGWPSLADESNPGWVTVPTDNFYASLDNGQSWTFRLTGNPVHSVHQPGARRGRVYPHVTDTHRIAWLAAKGEAAGFSLVGETTRVFETQRHDFSKGSTTDNTRQKVMLNLCDFDGMLQVTDPALFRDTLINGLGRGKAYGAGLMTLAPVADQSQG